MNKADKVTRSRIRRLRRFRWMQIIILMVVYIGGMELVTIFGWLDGVGGSWRDLPATRKCVTGAFLSFSVFTLLLRSGVFDLRHFRRWHVINYPPLWVPAFLAVVGRPLWRRLVELNGIDWLTVGQEVAGTALPMLLGLTVAVGLYEVNRQWVKPSAKQSGAKTITGLGSGGTYRSPQGTLSAEDVSLLEWLASERPIQHPDEDRLGYSVYARRIAKHLLPPGSSSVLLVGPHGSGKSSILNMVRHYLRHPDKLGAVARPDATIILVGIDGWARVRENIAQQVLTIVIEDLRRHVDISALVGLPVLYEQMLTAGHPVLGAAVKALLAGGETAHELLWRLDNILAAARLHLILLIEDLDRDIDDNVLKVEMPGLLDRLKNLGHVSFVVATTKDAFSTEIFQRICEHTEEIV